MKRKTTKIAKKREHLKYSFNFVVSKIKNKIKNSHTSKIYRSKKLNMVTILKTNVNL